ncbi:MAG: sigma factor-like helix-turn-helix DNA-binding protein, partial [Bacteroidota bacterium]|nr:sigma factor-like helix-turn-helix DNA-binding protein [Bacteroidota bacterium]
MGIEIVGEIMLTPGAALLKRKNFGKNCLNELKDVVRSLCLTGSAMLVSSNDETASDIISIDYSSYESMVSNFIEQVEKKKRNQDLFKERLCFEGGKVPTLEELGQTFGITRERVRQIFKKIGQKLERKANIEKLFHFWERLDCCVVQGGGVVSLRALPTLLQSEFKWPTAPYSLALGQLLLCRQEVALKDDELLFVESECLSCSIPLQQLQVLDFADNQAFHVQVIAAKLSRHCQSVCPWKRPVTTFHRAFIDRLVAKCDGSLILREDVVLSRDKWLRKYCDSLDDVACYVLESHGKPMHFRDIAGGIRQENENFVEISDHNVHASIMRYSKIEIVDRGMYGLKLWGLGGYRSVTTAIEDFIKEEDLPQKRQDIINHLKGEFSEANITTSLTKKTRFTNIGNGLFYDLPQNWQNRTCQELIRLLPEPVAEFARYLVGKNNTSYKLVMALIYIRSMDENETIPLYKLKEMFYRFY